ncbi:MAG: hypothetical protein ACTSR7_11730 [Promethearchaeota archaeon]
MDKDELKLKKGILLLIIGLTPIILFALTYSQEVWSGNWSNDQIGQEDFTIPPPNFLLGDRYHLIAGDEFASFRGYIDGYITIYNKATGENTTYIIDIDASTPYWSWSSNHFDLILFPGDYTLFWHTDVGIEYYIYSHGWFMIAHDEPREVNQLQNLITMVTGFISVFLVIAGIAFVSGNLRTDKKKGSIRDKRLMKDEIKIAKLEAKMQKKADKKSN